MAASNGRNFKVIGTRPIRHDGVDKVTGRAMYGADYAFPDMLFGKMLRSPYSHARIKSIKTDQAAALPGVIAVITSANLPELPDRVESAGEAPINLAHLSQNLMARDKVLYDGHAIAAVCATSPHIAEEAVKLIEVEYEVLPPVMTVEEAIKPGATILLSSLRNKEEGDKQTNVASHLQFKRGDVAEGFKSADYVVEREFKTAMVHQGYIEPHNAVAKYDSDGKATLWCSTQGGFGARALTAAVAGIAETNLKV
ncbi:MAG: xanthine dehydrogenase family protein molybdopterin-binding subunit, partial [Candidatus Binataceae bacterium]